MSEMFESVFCLFRMFTRGLERKHTRMSFRGLMKGFFYNLLILCFAPIVVDLLKYTLNIVAINLHFLS